MSASPRALPVLHPLVHSETCDGTTHKGCRPAEDCVRSWFFTPCPHHPKESKPHPQLCALQRCESSADQNGKERARDAWDGTSEVRPRGLRFFGETPLGVFVFTLPAELRPLCVGERQRRFRKAAGEMAVEICRRRVGEAQSLWWAKSWFHPAGDEDPSAYHPHENVIIPLAYFVPRGKGGRAHRVGWLKLPKSWLGVDGWICEAWRARLVEIFGQWWKRGAPPPATLPFYEWRVEPREKMHSLGYFGRTFPGWVGVRGVHLRPRSFGLAHWKHRGALVSAQLTRDGEQLPPFDACEKCIEEGVSEDELPQRLPIVGRTPSECEEQAPRALAAHTCALCQAPGEVAEGPYLDNRRIMKVLPWSTGPPSTAGPPDERFDPVTGEILEGLQPAALVPSSEACP